MKFSFVKQYNNGMYFVSGNVDKDSTSYRIWLNEDIIVNMSMPEPLALKSIVREVEFDIMAYEKKFDQENWFITGDMK